MRDFTYQRPAFLDEACRLAAAPGAVLLAGGQGLVLDLRARRRSPSNVVDLGDVLPKKIELHGTDSVVVGAGVTHAEIASAPAVRDRFPFLVSLAAHVGDPAVRQRGTLGGAVATNDPAGDWPAACLALDAEIQTTARRLRADDFFTGRRRTALVPGEIVVGIAFRQAERGAYVKLLNPASRYAMVGVFVAFAPAGPRVAITGAATTGVFRWRQAEERLAASADPDSLRGLTLAGVSLAEDLFADAAYRAHLAGVLTRRAASLTVSSPVNDRSSATK